ncbi:MAG: DUF192 domain-containing protein [Nevskiaceae bacterium]|nr:MAG: DUF192 domain-containing protein [Nevskiaceae bacterium]
MRTFHISLRYRPWLGWICIVLGLVIFVASFTLPGDRPSSLTRARVDVHGTRFDVDVASTPEARATGLMGRAELPPGTGMVFIYPDAQPREFWMKHTSMPLDMLFFDAQLRLVHLWLDVPPCVKDPCPAYPSRVPAQFVLEVAGGTARASGVRLGDRMSMPSTPSSSP